MRAVAYADVQTEAAESVSTSSLKLFLALRAIGTQTFDSIHQIGRIDGINASALPRPSPNDPFVLGECVAAIRGQLARLSYALASYPKKWQPKRINIGNTNFDAAAPKSGIEVGTSEQ